MKVLCTGYTKIRDACNMCDMGDLNLRDVPEELRARLKTEAAVAGIPMREHCLRLLGAERIQPSKTTEVEEKRPVREIVEPVKQERFSGCSECGALIGHQKFCNGRK